MNDALRSLLTISSQRYFRFYDDAHVKTDESRRPEFQPWRPEMPYVERPHSTFGCPILPLQCLLHRSMEAFNRRFPTSPWINITRGGDMFDWINPAARIFTMPLSNYQEIDGTSVIWMEEAFARLCSSWQGEIHAPIDIHAFDFLLKGLEREGRGFFENLELRYGQYSRVTILFADVLTCGKDRSLYAIWERDKIRNRSGYRLVPSEFFPHCIKHDEIILMCYVQRRERNELGKEIDMITMKGQDDEPFEGLFPQGEEKARDREVLKIAELAASGLPIDEFIRQKGDRAFARVFTDSGEDKDGDDPPWEVIN